jgi:hypothetical protein
MSYVYSPFPSPFVAGSGITGPSVTGAAPSPAAQQILAGDLEILTPPAAPGAGAAPSPTATLGAGPSGAGIVPPGAAPGAPAISPGAGSLAASSAVPVTGALLPRGAVPVTPIANDHVMVTRGGTRFSPTKDYYEFAGHHIVSYSEDLSWCFGRSKLV